jgi:hypothetical protein
MKSDLKSNFTEFLVYSSLFTAIKCHILIGGMSFAYLLVFLLQMNCIFLERIRAKRDIWAMQVPSSTA